MRRSREVGCKPGQEAGRHSGERQGLLRAEHALQRLGHGSIRM
jgi:hypothetical protein